MKKSLALILAVVMVLSLGLAACGGEGGGDATYKDTMTVSAGGYPDTIDPALNSAVDGATYIIHAFAGLTGYNADCEIVADCAKELPEAVALDNGMVSYTYELKDGLKWSDGSDLTAEDFVYAWNRAASPATAADYCYMFELIDGYAEMWKTDDEGNFVNPDAKLNVKSVNDGKALEVVVTVEVPYFHELCAFPAYMPVKADVVDADPEGWATKAASYIGNGPYKVTDFTQAQLVMEKNEYYHNADAVKTKNIIWPFNEDDNALYANFQSGSYDFIDSVPNDQIDSIASRYADEYKVTGQLGTYYVSFNVNDEALKDFTEAERIDIRKALGLMLDRNYIVDAIGQAGQVPANTFVAMGLTDADGKTEFMDNANGGNGYFSVKEEDYATNCQTALTLLEGVAKSSGKFTVADGTVTGFPVLTYLTNEGTGHEALAAYMQDTLKGYGIEIKIEVQEWGTFLDTRKAGNYSIARNGWLGDYNDPISFLDMWISNSGNNDCQFGKGAHADYKGYSYDGKGDLTWAESYDAIIAKVKGSKDAEERFALMHQAEDLLMTTGAICPIYYYTDQFMISQDIEGAFASPLGFKYFMYATIKA
ncbi:MAG: peptide ABC transporter substrate-binding protein [Ruminococcus sp.]|nr:peptide ABC transporter substrate-binding protein [Ruminococcus sp.]